MRRLLRSLAKLCHRHRHDKFVLLEGRGIHGYYAIYACACGDEVKKWRNFGHVR